MNNDELKKKIVKILANCKCEECAVEYCADCEGNPCIENCREKQQADALIAAGIGDVKEAEHRAEKTERALHCLARSFAEAMCKYGDDTHYLVDGFIQDAYSQAEKKLAEEGNK